MNNNRSSYRNSLSTFWPVCGVCLLYLQLSMSQLVIISFISRTSRQVVAITVSKMTTELANSADTYLLTRDAAETDRYVEIKQLRRDPS